MTRIEEIQKMFEEMGLGTEEDRSKFLIEEQQEYKGDQVFIRLGTTTVPLEMKENA